MGSPDQPKQLSSAPRNPDQITGDLSRLAFGEDGGTSPKLNDLVWEIIDDVCSSYELALLPLIGEDMTGEVNNTVFDYLSKHYDGAEGVEDDDDDN